MKTPINRLILDMDGVLWQGETAMPGLAEFFATLRELNIGFMLATNNATKTAVQYTAKLARFGVDVPPNCILTSAEATAGYVRERYEPGTAVYVVGDEGLQQAITGQGFHLLTPEQVLAGETAPVVVAGLMRTATYQHLAMGARLIRNGAIFIGTNGDLTYPTEQGPLPGAGAILAFLTASTGRQPITVGKPGPILFQEAVKRLGGDMAGTWMVGDRLETDILGAKNVGLGTILVLSGISNQADITTSGIQPDLIFADIASLTAELKRLNVYEH